MGVADDLGQRPQWPVAKGRLSNAGFRSAVYESRWPIRGGRGRLAIRLPLVAPEGEVKIQTLRAFSSVG